MTPATVHSEHDSSRASGAPPWLLALLIVIVTVAALGPVLGHTYVQRDDPMNLFENPAFNPPTLGGLGWYWRNAEAGLYIPITYTVWAGIAAVAFDPSSATLDPRYFHAANLLVHIGASLAVFALLRRLVGHDVPAAVGAAIFAVHPVQVETVAWISGLKDLLAGLFSIMALMFHVEHSRAAASGNPARRSTLFYAAGTMFLVLALLSKPIAIVVPLMAIAIDWGLLRRGLGAALAGVLPWVILTIPVIIIGLQVHDVPEVEAMMPLRVRPIVVGDALAFHIRHVLFPIGLAVDYGRSPDVIGANPLNLLWWLVPLGIGMALWIFRRRLWPVVIGAILFVVGLLPVLGFVPFGAQIYSTVTDHYLYLPMLGVALALAWAASVIPRRAALGIAVPLILVLGARSWFQSWHWKDTRALFSHNLEVNAQSWASHINLSAEALLRNESKVAEHHAREAIELRPQAGEFYINLGAALGQQRRFEDARDALEAAVRLAPEDPQAHYWLGLALAQLGRTDEAMEHLRTALQLRPAWPEAQAAVDRLIAAREKDKPVATRPHRR